MIVWADQGLQSGALKAARGGKTIEEAEQKVEEYLKRREEERPKKTREEREEKAVGALMKVWREEAEERGVAFDEEGMREKIRGMRPGASTATATCATTTTTTATATPTPADDEKTWVPPVRGLPEPPEVWTAKECPVCHKTLFEGHHDPETRHKAICWYFQGTIPHFHDETCVNNPLCQPRYRPAQARQRTARTRSAPGSG
jgi:hypothetical protein